MKMLEGLDSDIPMPQYCCPAKLWPIPTVDVRTTAYLESLVGEEKAEKDQSNAIKDNAKKDTVQRRSLANSYIDTVKRRSLANTDTKNVTKSGDSQNTEDSEDSQNTEDSEDSDPDSESPSNPNPPYRIDSSDTLIVPTGKWEMTPVRELALTPYVTQTMPGEELNTMEQLCNKPHPLLKKVDISELNLVHRENLAKMSILTSPRFVDGRMMGEEEEGDDANGGNGESGNGEGGDDSRGKTEKSKSKKFTCENRSACPSANCGLIHNPFRITESRGLECTTKIRSPDYGRETSGSAVKVWAQGESNNNNVVKTKNKNTPPSSLGYSTSSSL